LYIYINIHIHIPYGDADEGCGMSDAGDEGCGIRIRIMDKEVFVSSAKPMIRIR